MDRSQKAESVASLNAVFNEVGVVVVTRNLGLSVAQSTQLRTKMREAGASYKVAKNRLAKLAIKDTTYEGIGEFFTGPTFSVKGEARYHVVGDVFGVNPGGLAVTIGVKKYF